MCLGAYATVVELVDASRATVRFPDGATSDISLAVLLAEGTPVEPGDTVAVSIGMALHLVREEEVGR